MNFFKLYKISGPSKNRNKINDEVFLIVPLIKISLAMLGAWPGKKKMKGLTAIIGITIFSLTFQIWNAFTVSHDSNELLKSLETIIAVTSSLFKVFAFQLKYGSIKYVVKDIFKLWNHSKKNKEYNKVVKENAKISTYILKTVIVSYTGLAISYILNPIITYNVRSLDDRKFMFQATFPIVHAKQSPIFEIVFFCQFIAAAFCVNGNVLVDGMLIILVLHAKSKVFFIRQEIHKFSTVCKSSHDRESILQAATILIQKHMDYIKFTKYLQDIFSIESFILVMISTTINVGIGYIFILLLSEHTSNYIRLVQCLIYIVCGLMAMAAYCIAGEYLTFQSQLILQDLHNCPWYIFQPTDARLIMFMILRAQKPVTITVGKFSNLSLMFFTMIMKTSFSYLSLLRAVQK